MFKYYDANLCLVLYHSPGLVSAVFCLFCSSECQLNINKAEEQREKVKLEFDEMQDKMKEINGICICYCYGKTFRSVSFLTCWDIIFCCFDI